MDMWSNSLMEAHGHNISSLLLYIQQYEIEVKGVID